VLVTVNNHYDINNKYKGNLRIFNEFCYSNFGVIVPFIICIIFLLVDSMYLLVFLQCYFLIKIVDTIYENYDNR
jgi:hypothetical protein